MMMHFLGILLVLLYLPSLTNSLLELKKNPRVAVCVTGQVDRWIPEMPIENLVKANRDVHFSFFFDLQYANRHFQTAFNIEFGVPSNFTRLSFRSAFHRITEMYTRNNSEVVTFKFDLPYDMKRWQYIMGRSENESLDRIYEYSERQFIILNMYKNHLNCLDEIIEYESQIETRFDYVINAREDLYFFYPLNLMHTFIRLQEESCGFVSKNCITNYGVNMRLQIARRDEGLKLFGSRLAFYKWMFKSKQQIKNPEQFELFQLRTYGLNNCTLPVDSLPVTAARISSSGHVCLLEKEVQSLSRKEPFACVPRRFHSKVKAIQCKPFKIKPPLPPLIDDPDYPAWLNSTLRRKKGSSSSNSSSSSFISSIHSINQTELKLN
jgi:hypothetical protein